MIRLGILGTSRQAELAAVRPARDVPEIAVQAVAGRTIEAARAFAQRHGIPEAHGATDILVRSPEVDAVYVGLPNVLHQPTALAALRAGKHVLVEKPLALNASGCLELAAAAERTGAAVLEGIMVQHHPWQAWLRSLTAGSAHGAVRRIATRMSFAIAAERLERMPPTSQGGGVLRDVAPYWLQLVQLVAGLRVAGLVARARYHTRGFDVAAEASLSLDGGVEAMLSASFEGPYQASHEIVFERAAVRVEDVFRANLAHACVYATVAREGGTMAREALGPANAFVCQARAFAALVDGPPALRVGEIQAAVQRQRVTDELLADLTP
jgi:predicted dehydrogenase